MKGTSILFSFAPSFHSMATSLCDNLILFSTINGDVTIGIFLPQIEKEHCLWEGKNIGMPGSRRSWESIPMTGRLSEKSVTEPGHSGLARWRRQEIWEPCVTALKDVDNRTNFTRWTLWVGHAAIISSLLLKEPSFALEAKCPVPRDHHHLPGMGLGRSQRWKRSWLGCLGIFYLW